MQCHNCPKSVTNGGTPDEECFSCRSADYLDNDFKTVTPIDDVSKLSNHIEKSYIPNESSLKSNGDLINYKKGENTKRNLEDCENALKVFKNCHHSSYKFIAILLSVFLSVGQNADVLNSILDGKSLAEYARTEETSKQNMYQIWERMCVKEPILREVAIKRNRLKKKK